jgi:uncharacterized protein (TIGR03435 family)
MIRLIIVCLLAISASFAQTPLEFEVASIRPTAEQPQAQVAAGVHIDGSQVRVTSLSIKDYVVMAYRTRINQVVGPDWIGSQRFDIAAKLPEGSKQSDVPAMLQALLANRFRMKMHREMKEFPIYVLEAAKTGFKLVESEGSAGAADTGAISVAAGGNANGVAISFGNGASFTLAEKSLETKKLNMATFADMLTRFLDRPVIDRTNLKGAYDMTLDLTPEDRLVMLIRSAVTAGVVLPPQALALLDVGSSDSLSNSLRKAGLTLESRREQLEVIVVDEIQKTPTEN